MASIKLIFHNYLRQMLSKERGAELSFLHHLDRRASIKDVIESFGIPHPLIGDLTVNKSTVGFDYIMQDKDVVEVHPLAPPVQPLAPHILRPEPLDRIAFVADVNVGKLACHFRMLGFDTLYGTHTKDGWLAELAYSEKRILLTRDTSLLKRKIVMHGYLPRAEDPAEQLVEVVRLYDLASSIKPLTRCIPCNGLLVPVSKETVLDRLEPLTRKYYETFHICRQCGRIYWPGTHQEKITAFIRKIIAAVSQGTP